MKRLLIGTTNKAKLEEYRGLLAELPLHLVSLNDLQIDTVAPEDGKTFEENAVAKAKFYYEKSGIPTLVDDGGFEIEALGGEPGIKSHRWLGHEMSDAELINEVLKRMKGKTDRNCRLNLVVAIATPFGIITSTADVKGEVAEKPAAKLIEGYPYRSLMYFPAYGKYYCDLNEEEHEILNHRKHALEKVHDLLIELAK